MTDLTELEQQAALMRAALSLTEAAGRNGARMGASWTFYPHGLGMTCTLRFDHEPTGAELDPWVLAIGGACRVRHMPYRDTNGAPRVQHYLSFEYQGQSMEIGVSVPAPEWAPAGVLS